MVHQHFRLVEPFTVAENVVLGDHRDVGRRAPLPPRPIERRSASWRRYGLEVDPRARMWQLSVGEQQRVEILKALYREARDPDPRRADRGPHTAGGRGAVRDAARDGRRRADGDVHLAQAGRGDGGRRPRHGAARRPLGRNARRSRSAPAVARGADGRPRRRVRARTARAEPPRRDVVLVLGGLGADGDRGGRPSRTSDLRLRAARSRRRRRVAGNGQRELAEAIAGMRRATGGRVSVGGATRRSRPARGDRRRRRPHPRGPAAHGLAAGLHRSPRTSY